jgi:hypothetical protein
MHTTTATLVGLSLCILAVGCGAEPQDGAIAEPLSFSGVTEDGDDCFGGTSFLTLTPDPDIPDRWQGEHFTESGPSPSQRFRSVSRVQADRLGSVLHVTELEEVSSDTLPDWLRWCDADYDLVWDDGADGAELVGDWRSRDCGCQGRAHLAMAPAWGD